MINAAMAKVVFIGDSGVGKTSVIRSFAGEEFSEAHLTTIGIDFKTKTVPVYGGR